MAIQDKFSLSGKVAVITGASKGIGESMARAFGEAGAKVVISSRKQEALDVVAASFKEAGIDVLAVAANVGNMKDNKRLVEATLDHFGGIDILVNNAAANPVFGPALQTEEWAFDKIMNVNVKGPFELAKKCYPSMKERGGGSIINISSVGGIRPEFGLGIYSVSKASLISLTKVLAKEWGVDKIRANVICPGLIKTKFSEALWKNDDISDMVMQHLSIKEFGEPEDIAALALYLAADAGRYATGGVFTSDAGLTI